MSGREIVTLGRLIAEPGLLDPPEPVVAPFAWSGRVTLLAAREKAGKSTLASYVAARASDGREAFGHPVRYGPVLWVALEEHLGDLAGRLVSFDAEPDHIHILHRLGENPLTDLRESADEVKPSLVVIDTLAAFTQALDLDPGNASAWTPVMSAITRTARDSGAGILLLHHGRKSDGKFRDSSAIGAGVDVILEMDTGEGYSRKVDVRARWKVDNFEIHLLTDLSTGKPRGYELRESGDDPTERVWRFIQFNPGASKRTVRNGVPGQDHKVDDALEYLQATGAIENRGSGNRHAYHCLKSPATLSGHGAP